MSVTDVRAEVIQPLDFFTDSPALVRVSCRIDGRKFAAWLTQDVYAGLFGDVADNQRGEVLLAMAAMCNETTSIVTVQEGN